MGRVRWRSRGPGLPDEHHGAKAKNPGVRGETPALLLRRAAPPVEAAPAVEKEFVQTLDLTISSEAIYSPSCGRSIFVAGFAFTPRLVPTLHGLLQGEESESSQQPDVSRADPLVDEGRDAFP